MWLDILYAALILGGYVWVALWLLPTAAHYFSELHVKTTGLVSFFWWCVALPFFLLAMFLHLIHAIIAICCGISLANDVRDWWHKKD